MKKKQQKNNEKQKKNNENQQKMSDKTDKTEKIPLLFTIGELDLTLHIDFLDEDLEIKFDDLNELKNLSFLDGNKKLLNRFKVKSKNELLKLLLIGNRNSEKQCQIDYICFGFPKFEGEEEFFKKVLGYITEKNGLKLNEKPLNVNGKYRIRIEMTHKGKEKVITIETKEVDEHEDDNEIKGEGQSAPEDQKPVENDDDEDEYGDYEPNEMMKKGYIPKFRRKKSVLCNLEPNSLKFDLVYFNFDDLNKIPGNFKLEDMYELLEFFKKKKSTIFLNYFKEENNNENDEKEKGKEKGKEKENEKEKEKEKEKENEEKEKNENDNTKNKNKKNKNEKNEPSPEMIQLNKFYYITDIYFFDKKQAIKSFDEHYKSFTTDDPKKTINSRSVFDYFVKGIATGTLEEVPCEKTGLFLDELNNFIIIKVSKGGVDKSEFNPQPFPKINTHNIEEVSYYKDIIKQNKNDFYSMFLSGMVTSMGASAPKCAEPEVIIPSFLTGIDIIKRKIELLKNGIEIPDEENFYKVKRDPKIIAEQLENLAKGQKEGNFKLDCTNLITSNKKEYVSLYDYHLKDYFSREINRKDLQNKGFINSEGYIKYDPVFRNVMGTNNKNKKKVTDKEKQDKIISTIKDINLYNRLKDKEIDCHKEALNQKDITDKKIPFKKDKKIKKKKKKIDSNEGGSSNSGSSDEENGKTPEN